MLQEQLLREQAMLLVSHTLKAVHTLTISYICDSVQYISLSLANTDSIRS